MKRFLSCSAAAAASLLLVSSAAAHLHLFEPPPRYDDDDQKFGPCGKVDNPASNVRTTVLPGSTITVEVDAYINHPGYYRIAFDDDGDDGFVDPVNVDDVYNVSEGTNGIVLLDHWLQKPCNDEEKPCPNPDAPDERALEPGPKYTTTVTLPDIECDGCTLQVMQVMTDKNGAEDFESVTTGKDFYYRCANLRLSVDAPDAGVDPGTPDAGVDPDPADAGDDNTENSADPDAGVSGGCAVGAGGAGGAGVLLLGLGLVALRRRVTAL